jgi:HlyD family secretion protein
MLRNMDELLPLPYFNDEDKDGEDVTTSAPVWVRSGSSWWKRRGLLIVIAVLLMLILLGGLAFPIVQGRMAHSTPGYTQVTRGNFALTVSATGPIQSATYNVDFSGTGKIAEIDVSVGERVTQGQVLARMDKTSLQDAVNSTQAAVLSAMTALNNAQNTYGKTATQAQAALAAAQISLKNAQTNLVYTQSQTQAALAAAETSLADAQNSLLKIEAESQASIASAQTALTDAQNNLTAVQALAKQQIAVAYDQEQQAIQNCNAVTPPATPTPDCVKLAEDKYNQVVATANANITNAQNQVNSAQQQLATAQTQAAANNAQAQAQVNAAESQLNTAQAQANSGNAQAQAQISTAQSQLKTAIANAASSETTAQGQISAAQAQLNSVKVQLQTARHNLENATLTASHAGIVMSVNGTVGSVPGVPVNGSAISGGTPTFIQIVDVSTFQVLAYVNESDTAFLKVGEPALFTVSAYSGRTFRGVVSALSPNGQTVSNVVTYPVYIDVNMSDLQGANLLPGMTANVTINVVQRNNVVLIPASAVNFARTASGTTNTSRPLITQNQANVALNQARQMLRTLQFQQPDISNDNPIPAFVLERSNSNEQFIAKPVVLGLTDDTVYEVLAGLSPGASVVTGVATQGVGHPTLPATGG